MRDWFQKLWCSLNYRFCMVEAYRASHRGEVLVAADWQSKASDWERDYIMCGRTLV